MTITLEQAEAALGKKKFSAFVKLCWSQVVADELVWEPHMDLVCDHLEALFYRDISRLVINIPPSLSKSLLTNVFFPAWCWIKDPTFRMGFLGNDQSLTRRDARKCRSLIEGDYFQQRWALRILGDANRIEEFAIEGGGVRQCFTIRQQITGHHFHLIAIDDPHKAQNFNIGEGEGEAAGAARVYDDVLPTRFINQGMSRIVLIMQRLAENDLAGHVLETESNVIHLKLPMEFVPEDRCVTPFGEDWRVHAGELLAPKRFPPDALESLKARFHSARIISAQLQQNPVPDEGVIFLARHFTNRYKTVPEGAIYYISVDCTFKETDKSDFVVPTVWARKAHTFYLVDMLRGRWGFVETVQKLLSLTNIYPQYRAMLIEDKANGSAIIDALRKTVHRNRVVEFNPGKSTKVERAYAVTPMFDNYSVAFPEREPLWWPDYYTELLHFPNGKHDDCVDSTTQILLYMSQHYIPNMKKVTSNLAKALPAFGSGHAYR